MSRNVGKILVIKPEPLEGIIAVLPALTVLREKFPNANISWLIRPEFKSILNRCPEIDEVIIFDRKFFSKAWYRPDAFIALLSIVNRLRSAKYDFVFDFQGIYRSASLAWMSGCKRIFGMGNAREFASIFYTHRIFPNSKSISNTDFYIKIANAAYPFISSSALLKGKAFKKPVRSSISKTKKKPEEWLIDFSYLIPRYHREPILGDILEDCHELRERRKSEHRILAQIIWQLVMAIFKGWLEVIIRTIIRILIIIHILSIK